MLLGVDPYLRDGAGVDAFQLASKYPNVTAALSLAATIRKLRTKVRKIQGISAHSSRRGVGAGRGDDDTGGALVERVPPAEGVNGSTEGFDGTEGARLVSPGE